MKRRRELRVYFSHAFAPNEDVYDLGELRSAVRTLLEAAQGRLNKEHSAFRVTTLLDMTDYGRSLPGQIRDELANCHFAIVDISDNNPNVLYELGYLTARGIPFVAMKSGRSSHPVPSDICDIMVGTYEDVGRIPPMFAERVVSELGRLLSSADSLPASHLYDLWFPSVVPYLHVVCSPEAEKTSYANVLSPNYMYLDNFGDKDALVEALLFLARFYPGTRRSSYSSEDFPTRHLEENLVVIGGPGELGGEGNQIARTLLSKVKSKISYSDDCETLCHGGIEYGAARGEDGAILTDYGYFGRFPNPFNPANTIVLIHGIHTFGVLGAMRAFSDHPSAQANCNQVTRRATHGCGNLSFECFFEVEVVGGEVLVPEVKAKQILFRKA